MTSIATGCAVSVAARISGMRITWGDFGLEFGLVGVRRRMAKETANRINDVADVAEAGVDGIEHAGGFVQDADELVVALANEVATVVADTTGAIARTCARPIPVVTIIATGVHLLRRDQEVGLQFLGHLLPRCCRGLELEDCAVAARRREHERLVVVSWVPESDGLISVRGIQQHIELPNSATSCDHTTGALEVLQADLHAILGQLPVIRFLGIEPEPRHIRRFLLGLRDLPQLLAVFLAATLQRGTQHLRRVDLRLIRVNDEFKRARWALDQLGRIVSVDQQCIPTFLDVILPRLVIERQVHVAITNACAVGGFRNRLVIRVGGSAVTRRGLARGLLAVVAAIIARRLGVWGVVARCFGLAGLAAHAIGEELVPLIFRGLLDGVQVLGGAFRQPDFFIGAHEPGDRGGLRDQLLSIGGLGAGLPREGVLASLAERPAEVAVRADLVVEVRRSVLGGDIAACFIARIAVEEHLHVARLICADQGELDLILHEVLGYFVFMVRIESASSRPDRTPAVPRINMLRSVPQNIAWLAQERELVAGWNDQSGQFLAVVIGVRCQTDTYVLCISDGTTVHHHHCQLAIAVRAVERIDVSLIQQLLACTHVGFARAWVDGVLGDDWVITGVARLVLGPFFWLFSVLAVGGSIIGATVIGTRII